MKTGIKMARECADEPGQPDLQRTLDTLLEELREVCNSIGSRHESDKDRYSQFLRTLMVNAIRAPDHITPDNVAFFCDAALKGYTLNRAVDKFNSKSGVTAIILENDSAMRQAEIDELVECLSQCEDVLAPLAKEPGVNPWLVDVRKLLAKHGRDAFAKWADGLIEE